MKECRGDGAETGERCAEMVCAVSRIGGGEEEDGVGGAELGGGRGESGGERRGGFFDNRCTFFLKRGRAVPGARPSRHSCIYLMNRSDGGPP